MLEYVNADSSGKLIGWLYSLNPELSIYGALGLRLLEMKGRDKVDSDITDVINALKKLNIGLRCCEGCRYGVERAPKDLLKRRYLRQIHSGFQWGGVG